MSGRVVNVRFVLIVAICAATSVSVSTATAAEVKVRSCSLADAPRQPVGSAGWTFRAGPLVGGGEDDCPVGGLGFANFDPADAESATWSFSTFKLLALTRAEFAVEGDPAGSGVEYSVTCSYLDCDWSVPIAVAAGNRSSRFDIVIPGDAFGLTIKATCAINPCDVSRLRFRDFLFTSKDDRPPVMPPLTQSLSMAAPGDWRRPNQIPLDFLALDNGFGMGWIRAHFDDEPAPFFQQSGCRHELDYSTTIYFVPLPCAGDTSALVAFRDADAVRSLPDGPHSVTIEAFDSLGNGPTTMRGYFSLDKTPPATPQDVVLSRLAHGVWTASESVEATWSNGGETHRTSSASGIAQGWQQLVRREPAFEEGEPSTFGLHAQFTRSSPIQLPSDGLWDLYVWLVDGAGNVSGRQKVTVGRDQDAPPPPTLVENPWLNGAALAAGHSQRFFQPNDPAVNSGICGYAMEVNATEQSNPVPEVTHSGADGFLPIPESLPDGENYLHARAVSCAGVASTTATTGVLVDKNPPTATVAGIPVDGAWSRSHVTARISAADDRSGVSSITNQLVPGESETSIGSEPADVVIPEGTHDLRFTATDVAGNSSATESVSVNIDATGPDARFLASDPVDPTRILAEVRDALSGVADARILYRSAAISGAPWHPLATAATGSTTDPSRLSLSARIPDTQLPDGRYELMIAATDVAGNGVESTVTAAGDSQMTVTLPLRSRPAVTAGLALYKRKCRAVSSRRRSSCSPTGALDLVGSRSERVIGFAQRAAVAGELRDARGGRLAGVALEVYETPVGGAHEYVGSVVTNPFGGFRFEVGRGPSRRITVTLAGTETTLGVSTNAMLWVRTGATLTARIRGPRRRPVVSLRGRLLSGSSAVPERGKLIQLQRLTRGGTDGFATAHTDADGRFTARYRVPSGENTRQKIRFRAVIPAESGWPFEAGSSATAGVRLRSAT